MLMRRKLLAGLVIDGLIAQQADLHCPLNCAQKLAMALHDDMPHYTAAIWPGCTEEDRHGAEYWATYLDGKGECMSLTQNTHPHHA